MPVPRHYRAPHPRSRTRVRGTVVLLLLTGSSVTGCGIVGGATPVPTLTSTAIPQTGAPSPQETATAQGSAAPTDGASAAPVSTSASATPTPPTNDEAVAQATEAVRAYYRGIDAAGADPAAGVDALTAVAVGAELAELQQETANALGRGWVQTGTTKIVSTDLVSVDRMADLTAVPPLVPAVILDVCYDVSGLDVLDRDGKSLVSLERVDVALTTLTVTNYEWPSAQGWKVSETASTGEPC